MRHILSLVVLAAALPLAGCNTQTAQGTPPVKVAAVEPQKLEGATRDKEWMKLAPSAVVDPKIARATIDYATPEAPGTVIVATKERRLYYVLPGGKAVRYPVAVGKAGMSWSGTAEVDRKLEWPDWNPPAEMLARRPDLPSRTQGGPYNPIGARALYLAQNRKDTLFRIHGTNEPEKIGQAVSSGCIRMLNEDVMDLYDRVPIGSKVIVR
ncbi:L,D-transpeptidase [Methylobacterium organophilum]|uniref:L,D-transpeptidase n=1 Tax=Methylobacterium organophilum TaxID=410 RepID=UPI001F12B818|nr:L,D-transpeptidase [Methylobacterium organophilum]UMY15760.1 L,D-transpeptidase [Methylobacterium organophilum]